MYTLKAQAVLMVVQVKLLDLTMINLNSITTPAINGVGTISFYREYNSGGGTIVMQTSTDGTNFSTIDERAYSGTTYSEYSYSLNQSGTVYIKVAIFDEPGHLIVDEFSTTAYGSVTPPGITLSASSGNTDESGSSTSFTVVLDAAPTSDVVLDITSDDTSENTVSPSSLTFTSADWDSAQTVTVTGVDDQVSDGNIDSTITVSVNTEILPSYDSFRINFRLQMLVMTSLN